MRKIFAVIMTLSILFGCVSLTAFAEESEPLTAEVYVTVADKGNLVLTQEKITVTDTDGDGSLTINDALYAAHEAKYEGGAEAGFASSYGAYGLSIDKLWGDNSGSFGYYVNNASAWSLADPVKEGDYVNAFVYTDSTAWSDTYCWFDVNTVSADAGKEITLTLLGAGYDEAWNPVTVPVVGATITVNGEKTESKTDSEGKATIKIADGGTFVLSAVSDTQLLIPPVCSAVVSAAEPTPPAQVITPPAAVEEKTESIGSEIPKTADSSNIVFIGIVAVMSAGALAVLSVIRKKADEK